MAKLFKHVIRSAIDKNTKHNKPIKPWLELDEKVTHFQLQLKHCRTTMAFAFVEGSLIRAVKEGNIVV